MICEGCHLFRTARARTDASSGAINPSPGTRPIEMRKGRRKPLAPLGLFLLGTVVSAAPPDHAAGPNALPVRLTVEINWNVPVPTPVLAGEPIPLELSMTEG